MKQFLFLLTLGCLFSGCWVPGNSIEGNGNIVTKEFKLSDFSTIIVENSLEVEISPANNFSIKATTDENLMRYIKIEKRGDRLRISRDGHTNLHPSKEIISITMPLLAKLNISGASSVSVLQPFPGNNLTVHVSGASRAKIFTNANQFGADVSGASELMLKGASHKATLSVTGASHVKGFPFKSDEGTVSATGASTADISASGKLDANATGASAINYRKVGELDVQQRVSGSSAIKEVF